MKGKKDPSAKCLPIIIDYYSLSGRDMLGEILVCSDKPTDTKIKLILGSTMNLVGEVETDDQLWYELLQKKIILETFIAFI